MTGISKVYRFDRNLAQSILETAQSHASSGGVTTVEMVTKEPFADYPYEAVVANCLYLWNDACIHLQVSDTTDDARQGKADYHISALTGIGEDRLCALQDAAH